MASLVAAVRRGRRPVTVLLIAVVAFVLTAGVLAWSNPVNDALSAAPTATITPAPSHPAPSPDLSPAISPAPSGPASAPPATTASPEPTGEPQLTAELERRLQAKLDQVRKRQAIPGVSVTIILADGSAWTGVSGLANVKRKTPVETDTAFAIASVTKTYTGALIVALADEGRLDLDARLGAILADTRIGAKVTVRQLLDHTSGLPDYFLHGKIDKALFGNPGLAWSAKDAFRYVGKPLFPAGKGWYYSNTNYRLLGLVAEKVGGRPLAAQIRARFLEPVGLEHTWDQAGETPRGPLAHGYRVSGTKAKPRFTDLSDGSDVVPFTSVITAAGGAGSFAASSSDVARWARALYRGEVLPPATVRDMVQDARRTASFKPSVPYGLGVQLTPLDGRPALGHSGRLTGFRSLVRYLPGEGITIAVLTNESKQDPALIARALLRIVSPPAEPSPSPSSSAP